MFLKNFFDFLKPILLVFSKSIYTDYKKLFFIPLKWVCFAICISSQEAPRGQGQRECFIEHPVIHSTELSIFLPSIPHVKIGVFINL